MTDDTVHFDDDLYLTSNNYDDRGNGKWLPFAIRIVIKL